MPFLFLWACSDKSNIILSEFIDFGSNGIIAEKIYFFEPFKNHTFADSCFQGDLSLIIRYSDKCDIKTLPLYVEYMLSEQDTIDNKNLEIQLFDEGGESKGTCTFSINEIETPLFQNAKIDDYFFVSIKTKIENAPGILAAGIIVKPSKNHTDETLFK